jgi:hypothetical protein
VSDEAFTVCLDCSSCSSNPLSPTSLDLWWYSQSLKPQLLQHNMAEPKYAQLRGELADEEDDLRYVLPVRRRHAASFFTSRWFTMITAFLAGILATMGAIRLQATSIATRDTDFLRGFPS